MRRVTIFLIGALVFLLILGAGSLRLSRSRTYQIVGEVIPRVETSERVVALTFDDGPTSQAVDVLLPVLHSRNVKATFFVVGKMLEKKPELGRQIVGAGHELGNHSYSHQRMVFKSWSFLDQEIRRTDEIIRSVGYEGTIQFRPPYGKKLLLLPLYLRSQERPAITWDVEPDSDLAIPQKADEIAEYVLERVQPGSIVLLHPMFSSGLPARNAVAEIVDGLKKRGYTFVTVSELIAMRTTKK